MSDDIVRWPSDRLKKKCEPVRFDDLELPDLIAKMTKAMSEESGIGLAANQVGVLKAVVIVGVAGIETFLNPRLVQGVGSKKPMREGCLSLPGVFEMIPRYVSIIVESTDPKSGGVFAQEYTGLRAHVLQHEIEHLQGKFFLDHVSSARRDQIRAAIRKSRR